MAKKKTAAKKTVFSPPSFLIDLLEARSPSGYESEAHAVIDKAMQPVADEYEKDTTGNRFATVNPGGDPKVMFAGHMDELGLQVNYINEQGFLYFDTIGGHDKSVISGRRVAILTKNGIVKGVTGKRAIHLMSPEERKKVPETHHIWIDIAAKDKKEAQSLVRVGDCAVYDQSFELIRGTVGVARAFDNKAGAYVVNEALRRLKKQKSLAARVTAVSTSQEEIGTRGAITSAYRVQPDFAVAVDVGHTTDYPDSDKRKIGEFKLGGGPIICRGPNINPVAFDKLVAAAEKEKIPYQLEADPRPTGTDARSIQIAGRGVATGLVSVPLRYMHTPSEVVDLEDIERTVQLLVAFAKGLKKGERGDW